MARLSVDLYMSVHQPGPLLHAEQAKAAGIACLAKIEPRAAVANLEVQGAVLDRQGEMHRASVRMRVRISKRFLGNSVQGSCRIGGDLGDLVGNPGIHLVSVVTIALGQTAKRGNQAQVVNDGWMELVRYLPQSIVQLHGFFRYLPEQFRRFPGILRQSLEREVCLNV